MTKNEARRLRPGDRILYRGERWTVVEGGARPRITRTITITDPWEIDHA